MLVSILPKVAGIKVESSWGHGTGTVRCVARLTRSLTRAEAERLRGLLPAEEVEGRRIVHYCPLSGVEQWRERLSRSLLLAVRPARPRRVGTRAVSRPRHGQARRRLQ